MKKWCCILLIATLPLQAQEAAAAAQSSHIARATNLQNWIFASGALVAAAIGLLAVVCDTGSNVH